MEPGHRFTAAGDLRLRGGPPGGRRAAAGWLADFSLRRHHTDGEPHGDRVLPGGCTGRGDRRRGYRPGQRRADQRRAARLSHCTRAAAAARRGAAWLAPAASTAELSGAGPGWHAASLRAARPVPGAPASDRWTPGGAKRLVRGRVAGAAATAAHGSRRGAGSQPGASLVVEWIRCRAGTRPEARSDA